MHKAFVLRGELVQTEDRFSLLLCAAECISRLTFPWRHLVMPNIYPIHLLSY